MITWTHNPDSEDMAQLHRRIVEKQKACDQIDFPLICKKHPY